MAGDAGEFVCERDFGWLEARSTEEAWNRRACAEPRASAVSAEGRAASGEVAGGEFDHSHSRRIFVRAEIVFNKDLAERREPKAFLKCFSEDFEGVNAFRAWRTRFVIGSEDEPVIRETGLFSEAGQLIQCLHDTVVMASCVARETDDLNRARPINENENFENVRPEAERTRDESPLASKSEIDFTELRRQHRFTASSVELRSKSRHFAREGSERVRVKRTDNEDVRSEDFRKNRTDNGFLPVQSQKPNSTSSVDAFLHDLLK